jgi:hypothetical protein
MSFLCLMTLSRHRGLAQMQMSVVRATGLLQLVTSSSSNTFQSQHQSSLLRYLSVQVQLQVVTSSSRNTFQSQHQSSLLCYLPLQVQLQVVPRSRKGRQGAQHGLLGGSVSRHGVQMPRQVQLGWVQNVLQLVTSSSTSVSQCQSSLWQCLLHWTG